MGSSGPTHDLPWLDSHDPNATIAEQARRDARSCADIRRDEPLLRPEAIENGAHGLVGVAWAISDVVGGAIAETSDGVQRWRIRHAREYF